jgi:ABC-type branched-subunit amino acid transport system substrate-binding protein
MEPSRRDILTVAGAGLALAGTARLRAAFAAGGPIKVGVLASLTGGGAFSGPEMVKAYNALVAEVNVAGGIYGRKIELVIEDDQTSPDAGVRAAKKLVDIDKVCCVVGIYSSAVCLAVMPVLEAANVPLMTTGSSPDISTTRKKDLVFRTVPSDAIGGRAYVAAAMKLGLKKMAVLANNTPYGISLGDIIAAKFQAHGGTVAAKVVYNLGEASYRSEIEKATAEKPDLIVLCSYPPDAIQVFKEAYRLGINATWMAYSFAFGPEFVKAVGAEPASACISIDPAMNNGSPAYEHATALIENAGVKSVDLFGYHAYDQLMVFLLAIAAARGDTSGDAIKTHIRLVADPPGAMVGTWTAALPLLQAGKKINYEGATGPCDFNAEGDCVEAHGIYRFKDGKPVLDFVVSVKELEEI